MIRFASIGSGSGGNGLVVECGNTRLLLDCGFGFKDLERRLARRGLEAANLSGILVTHEHEDHASGVLAAAARLQIPVWLTYGTFRAICDDEAEPGVNLRIIDGHTAFVVDDMEVLPFPVPHDAREPVQFAFSDGENRLGVITDLGAPTRHVEQMLSGCEALVLECNHDADMLDRGAYPRWLKERVGGPLGHLANAQAASLVSSIDRSNLSHVVAAHLSASNNTPAHARAALAQALGCSEEWVGIADQATGFDWREIR